MSEEFEVVRHPHMEQLNLFIVTISHRASHIHRDLELILVLSGEGGLTLRGEAYPLQTGDLVLINPNDAHEIRSEGGITLLCLQIDPQCFREILPTMGDLTFDAPDLYRVLAPGVRDRLEGVLIELAYQYTLHRPHWQMLCSGLNSVLLYLLLRDVPYHLQSEEERRADRNRSQRLGRIMAYVEQHYTHKLLLSDIAKEEGVSMGYLSHFIRANLHQPFQEYVSSVRVSHAKCLLAGDKRLIDVSLESGFSDPRYMTKAFLRLEGCTPEEYRRTRARQEPPDRFPLPASEQAYFSQVRALALLEKRRRPLGPLLDGILG